MTIAEECVAGVNNKTRYDIGIQHSAMDARAANTHFAIYMAICDMCVPPIVILHTHV